jgi:hypothetical protein
MIFYVAKSWHIVNSEDHCDFDIIDEAIKIQMELTCKHVVTEAKVEHLHTCLTGELKNEMDEFYLLSSLHPIPVICGHPLEAARYFINHTVSMLIYEGSIKEEDKEIDKIFISSMITHESDKGMCLAMIVRENLVVS